VITIPEKKKGRRDSKMITPPVKTGGPAFPPYPSDANKYGLSILGWFAGNIATGLAANPQLVDLAFANEILAPRVTPMATGNKEVVGSTEYTFSTKTTAPPNSGSVALDNLVQSSATKIWLHDLNGDSVDVGKFLATIKAGQELYIQDKADSTFYQHYTVSAAAIPSGIYYEVPVTFLDGGGTLSNNARVVVALLGDPAAKLNAQDIAYVAYAIAAEMIDLRDEAPIDSPPVPTDEEPPAEVIGPPLPAGAQRTTTVRIGSAPTA
jgi:hypothetical protein